MTQRLTFGHIVNHREPKGTKYVLQAINDLYLSGHDFGFIHGEHLPHKTAMNLYDHIDIILEQFILGWYGLQAVECMAKGKLVVAWIDYKTAQTCVDHELLRDLPIFSCKKDNINYMIIQLLGMSQKSLDNIRTQSMNFVQKWHNINKIGNKIIKQYKEGFKK